MASSSSFTVVDILAKKRDGKTLTKEEIYWFIDAVSRRMVQDSQVGAWLMASYIQGLDDQETLHLTESMRQSGTQLKWPEHYLVADKHSTGGIADFTSPILLPCLLACGLKVPMISARGLGITGGTVDKFESIPNFRAEGSIQELHERMENIGGFMIGQTANLALADKVLYATRDVTATIASIPLICGSIMSKKGAEGLNALVLDVKFGNGSFMKAQPDAERLARNMVELGRNMGIKMVALVTDMNRPTGLAVGNSLEIAETLRCLRGTDSSVESGEMIKVVTQLGGHLLKAAGKVETVEEGIKNIVDSITTGAALEKFRQLIVAQGVAKADAEELVRGNVWAIMKPASKVTVVRAQTAGYIVDINAEALGRASCLLGAGRLKSTDVIDYAVGLKLIHYVGDHVNEGDPLVEIHHNQPLGDKTTEADVANAITLSATQPAERLNPVRAVIWGN